MFIRSITKCILSRSKNANLLSQIPLKSGLISRPVTRSGLLLNSSSGNKSTNQVGSTRSFHAWPASLAKRENIEKDALEEGESVKPVDLGKPTQRVAKIIASYGQCTKAQAEVLIQEGRVKVDGEVIKAVPTQVPIDSKIYVDGTLLKKPRPRVFIHYKKKMFLAKLSFEPDSKGRRNLFAVLQAMGVPSVVPIDTLDYSSEGIMLLTNDSMYKALLAKTAKDSWECLYKLKVLGEVTEKFIEKSREKGLSYHGEKYAGINIRVEETQGEKESSYTWLTVKAPASVSHVAMKDHFKRYGIYVSRLMRLTYGPYSLDNVNSGDVHEVPIKVIEKNIIKDGERLPIIENLAEPAPKKRRLTRMETKLKNKGFDPRAKDRAQDEKNEEDDAVEEDVMDDEDVDDEEVEEVKPRRSFDTRRNEKKHAYEERNYKKQAYKGVDEAKPRRSFEARRNDKRQTYEEGEEDKPRRSFDARRNEKKQAYEGVEEDKPRRSFDTRRYEKKQDYEEGEEAKPRRSFDARRNDQREVYQPRGSNAFDKNKPFKARFANTTKPWERSSKRPRNDDEEGDGNEFERRATRPRSDTNRSQFYREKKSGDRSKSFSPRKSSGGFKPKKFAPREDDD